MNAQDQVAILGNDTTLLDVSNRREAREGLWIITAPAELYPDGHCFEFQHRGDMDYKALTQFCNAAREAWNERNNGKEVATHSSASARTAGGDGSDSPAGESGGAGPREARAVPNPEGSLEEYLQSEVDRLGAALDAAEDDLRERRLVIDELTQEFQAAERALEAVKEVHK